MSREPSVLPLSAIRISPEMPARARYACAFLMQAGRVRASLRQGIRVVRRTGAISHRGWTGALTKRAARAIIPPPSRAASNAPHPSLSRSQREGAVRIRSTMRAGHPRSRFGSAGFDGERNEAAAALALDSPEHVAVAVLSGAGDELRHVLGVRHGRAADGDEEIAGAQPLVRRRAVLRHLDDDRAFCAVREGE